MAAKVCKVLSSCGSVTVFKSFLSSSAKLSTKPKLLSPVIRLRVDHSVRLQQNLFQTRSMAELGAHDKDVAVAQECNAVAEPINASEESIISVELAVEPTCLVEPGFEALKSGPIEDGNPVAAVSVIQPQPRRGPRMKAAILMSYSGQGYHGMQIQNNGTRTIENDLMTALRDSGVVDDEGYSKPKSIKFQRAARTDKNVSAARQIISLMVPKSFDVDDVNKSLPNQIRFMDFRKVTKGFDAKVACDSRTYLYMIPTFAFTPMDESATEAYRISSEVLNNLREILKLYHGTKNFHNFTSRKKPTDPSAMRYIMSFTSSEPFLKDGLEYIVLKVKGQSFMLHQIRKMIGLAVAISRGYASLETMTKSFTLDRIDIPMAPGLGLMLGEAHYDHYNRRFGSDGIHEPLIWDNVADKVEEFCQEKIYAVVTQTENKEKSMMQWLSTVPLHTYDIREADGTPKGYGPEGKAHLLIKKLNGEAESDDEMYDDDEDDEVPNKKRKIS